MTDSTYYILAPLVPTLLILAHILSDSLKLKSVEYLERIQSLAAGFSIGYVFLIILTEVDNLDQDTPFDPFLLSLLGFVLFHAALKFVFKEKDKERRTFLSDEVHLFVLALYTLIISFLLIELMKTDIVRGTVLAALVIIHTALSELGYHIAEDSKIVRYKFPVLLLTAFPGTVFAIAFDVSNSLSSMLFAFAAGMIIYLSMREEIPPDSKGSILFFILGALLVSAIAVTFF